MNNAINSWAFAAGCLVYLVITVVTYVFVVKKPLYAELPAQGRARGARGAVATSLPDLTAQVLKDETNGQNDKTRAAERKRLEEVSFFSQTTLWMVVAGLIFGIALQLAAVNASGTLLLGAIGGFLSPLVSVVVRKSKALVWGTILLAPVAGGLTAFGGYLLLVLLSSCGAKVLGESVDRILGIKADACPASLFPSGQMAPTLMGVALLLGFSGRLFASLALSSERFLTKAGQEDDPDDGGGKSAG